MNSASDVWMKVLSILETKLTSTAVNSWFSDSRAVELTGNSLIIYTPTSFKKNVITDRYLNPIKDALYELFASELDVVVLTENELDQANLNKENRNTLLGSTNYTFDSFVVGNSNRFAYNAAQAVAESLAERYNPLFIYGESGLGKTHLLYAISNYVHGAHPEYRVTYVKGEDFANELIRAIRLGTNQEFRDKYRASDLLLVDDIQFIAGKDSTQEEFFHTFNTLYEARKQIVLTSDRPANEMVRLDDRLRTRFEWGLIADIQRPDYETRMAIIKKKAVAMGLSLPTSILEYIAENITANVRQLEGTINKLLAYRELLGEDLNTDNVIRSIRELIKEKDEFIPSADEIIEETAVFYGVTPTDIRGPSRTKNIATARQIAMYLVRRITTLSLNEIGLEFNRDHTTVMHSLDKVEKLIKSDRATAETIKDITANINGRNY